MLNGCKTFSIFAIQDIELYFIFIAKTCKARNLTATPHSPCSTQCFLDPLTTSYHKKIMTSLEKPRRGDWPVTRAVSSVLPQLS